MYVKIHKMDLQNIIIAMMNLDLWFLISVKKASEKFVRLLSYVIEITVLISFVAGLLSIYALPQLKLQLAKYKHDEYPHDTMKSIKEETRLLDGISDDSGVRYRPEIEREINHLKSKAISLEMAFRRMNSQLRALHIRDEFTEDELADFASEAAGGAVLETPNTESYYEPKTHLSFFGIPLCKPNYFTPRKVIQPWSEAGECWAFRGDRGFIKIRLAYQANIEQISLEHVSPSASLTGEIDSAPREFQLSAEVGERTVSAGPFIYRKYGPPSQIFQITNEKFKKTPLRIITLEILSNWGNPNYTCIYRFKVHGKISL